MPVARGLYPNYPARGEQAAGLILIILKYIEIIACTPAKGERYTQNKPRRSFAFGAFVDGCIIFTRKMIHLIRVR